MSPPFDTLFLTMYGSRIRDAIDKTPTSIPYVTVYVDDLRNIMHDLKVAYERIADLEERHE